MQLRQSKTDYRIKPAMQDLPKKERIKTMIYLCDHININGVLTRIITQDLAKVKQLFWQTKPDETLDVYHLIKLKGYSTKNNSFEDMLNKE